MNDAPAALAGLTAALNEVGDALASADLSKLLDAEPRLSASLAEVASLSPDAIDRNVLVRARAALLRCRRLGASLSDVAGIATGAAYYSRAGVPATTCRAGVLEARG